MSDTKTGFFWHVHHDVLLEHSHDIDERIAYVKSHKPAKEVETRLRLMRPVIGELPEEVVKARKAHGKAWKAWGDARKDYAKACKAYDEACKAFNEAIQRNLPAIEELHRKECPGCSWNGKTIFP